MSDNWEQPQMTDEQMAAANSEAAKQYQLALEASANMIKKDLIANLIQIANANPLRTAAECQQEIADFVQNFTIPNAKFLLSVELVNHHGEKIIITPEVQFKMEIVESHSQVQN